MRNALLKKQMSTKILKCWLLNLPTIDYKPNIEKHLSEYEYEYLSAGTTEGVRFRVTGPQQVNRLY